MELLMEINVTITDSISVKGKTKDANLVYFTGTAFGPYFTGKVIGEGMDLQTFMHDGSYSLSARYVLTGTDSLNNECRVFIENNGNHIIGYTPIIVTDSEVLSSYESKILSAEVKPENNGVSIRIYNREK